MYLRLTNWAVTLTNIEHFNGQTGGVLADLNQHTTCSIRGKGESWSIVRMEASQCPPYLPVEEERENVLRFDSTGRQEVDAGNRNKHASRSLLRETRDS